jgi:glucuronosyltransferase
MTGMKLSADELKDRADLLLINAHPALGYIRPILPTTIQVGFMHIQPPNPIDFPKVKEFLDKSTKPIIYVSLGSNVYSSEMSEKLVEIFIKSFKSLRTFNVMWKWETEDLRNKPENLMISSWFPQSDVLADPKIKLFITHGGHQSIEEAIDRGVPMIVIPFTVDQAANAKRIEKLEIGIQLDFRSLNKNNLRKTIHTILNGDFKKNIMKLREIVNDEPMKPIEKAVWWVEYVIRHNGTKHLRYSAKNVPFYKRQMLDFIGISIISSLVALKLLSYVLRKVFSSKRKLIVKNVKSD